MKLKHNPLWLTALIVLVLSMTGCVDVPSTGPTPPNMQADFRFVNGQADLGAVSIEIDEQAIGSINFGEALAHQTYNAGSRTILLSNGDTRSIAMPSERRGTYVILALDAGVRDMVRLDERQRFNPVAVGEIQKTMHIPEDGSSPAMDSTVTVPGGYFRLASFMSDADVDVAINGTDALVSGIADTMLVEGLTYKGNSGYQELATGGYNLSVLFAGTDSVLATSSVTISSVRQTTLILQKADGSVQVVNLKDE
ncbi:DUF4397 domain-containing protein [candidate division KSB1 bacterium]|nr:DUF4397 domain-containing protein [candidate division KSB1 bacterium]